MIYFFQIFKKKIIKINQFFGGGLDILFQCITNTNLNIWVLKGKIVDHVI